jgi:GGDEF domain-containing protein
VDRIHIPRELRLTQFDSAWKELVLTGLLPVFFEAAFRGQEAEFKDFSKALRRYYAKLENPKTTIDVLENGGKIVRLLREHHERVTTFMTERTAEHALIVSNLLDAVTKWAGELGEYCIDIHKLSSAIKNADPLSDWQSLQMEITRALDSVSSVIESQNSSLRQEITTLKDRVHASDLLLELQQSLGKQMLERTQPRNAESAWLDRVTGFGGVDEFRQYWTTSIRDQSPNNYIVVFYIRRSNLILKKFGQRISDQTLTFVSQHIANFLHGNDDVFFRWPGCNLVGAIQRNCDAMEMREEIAAMFEARIEVSAADRNREAILFVDVEFRLCPIDGLSLAEVIARIDAFIRELTEEEAGTSDRAAHRESFRAQL